MATVRELITVWGFKVDDKDLKKLESGFQGLKNQAIGLAKIIGFGGAGVAGAVFGLAKSASEAGDKIAKTSAKLGIGSDAYQELGFAAKMAGIEQERFDGQLSKLSRSIADAATGTGPAADHFKAMGIAVKGANGQIRPTEDILLDLSDRFATMPDQTAKLGMAFDIFGRDAADVTLLLNQGSEAINSMRGQARALGTVMSGDALRAAEMLDDALDESRAIVTGLKNEIGVGLIPVVLDVLRTFKAWVLANRQLIKQKFTQFIAAVVRIAKILLAVFMQVANSVMRITRLFGGLERILKAVLAIFIAWKALQLARFMGDMVIGMTKLVAGLRLVSMQALKAQLRMAGIAIAIGLIIAAIALLVEDFITWTEGGDSVFGDFVKALEDLFLKIENVIKESTIFKFFDKISKASTEFFTGWKLGIGDIFTLALGGGPVIPGGAGLGSGASALPGQVKIEQNNTFVVPNAAAAQAAAAKVANENQRMLDDAARQREGKAKPK